MTFPGLEMTILKCHDFSRFSMTVRTLLSSGERGSGRRLKGSCCSARSGASSSSSLDVIFFVLHPPPQPPFQTGRRRTHKCVLAELRPTADEDGEGSCGQRDDERRAGEQRVDDPADALADHGLANIWTEDGGSSGGSTDVDWLMCIEVLQRSWTQAGVNQIYFSQIECYGSPERQERRKYPGDTSYKAELDCFLSCYDLGTDTKKVLTGI